MIIQEKKNAGVMLLPAISHSTLLSKQGRGVL